MLTLKKKKKPCRHHLPIIVFLNTISPQESTQLSAKYAQTRVTVSAR